MNYFKRFMGFIYNCGISEKYDNENVTTGFLNIMCFATSVSAFFIFLISSLYSNDQIYRYIAGFISLLYFVVILLNYFGKIKIARFYFGILMSVWFLLALLMIGGYIGQGAIATSVMIVIFMLYNRSIPLRNFLLAYNILVYSAVSIYLNFNEPILGARDHFLDEIFITLVCSAWIYAIFYVNEQRDKGYINSLKAKNKQLNEKTIDLERFTMTTTHDLKSPLTNISNFLTIMDQEIKNKEYSKLPEYLGYAQSCSYRMKELIEGVLEVSTNSNDQVINNKEVNLNELLSEVIAEKQEELNERNAVVTSDVLPNYNCNPADFRIIFQNLIINGVKYNDADKPKMVINTKILQNHILIQFTDNGIGIDEVHYKEIFQYFKRLHNRSAYPGTGLGLGLCKKIVEKYHGTIEVESVVGAYTSFKLILPKDWQAFDETTNHISENEDSKNPFDIGLRTTR